MYTNQVAVIIPNVHEYSQKGMDPEYPALLLTKWRNIASGFSDVALFWEGDDKLVVSPKPISDSFVEYITDQLEYKNVIVLTPRRYSTELCLDILHDDSVLSRIIDYVVGAKSKAYLRPWGATKQVYMLFDELQKRCSNFISEELPTRNDYWSSGYIGSKIGFRELCVKLQADYPNITIPKGFTCDSFENALEILRWFHANRKPCVLKASSGVGGYGNVFFTHNLFEKPYEEVEEYFMEYVKGLPYFNSGPVIVEETISTGFSSPVTRQGCTSSIFMSGLILPNGDMRIVGGGTDIRDSQCRYIGAEIGKNSPLDDVINLLKPNMYQIGNAIADFGYRGHWGVNFMMSRNDTPVAIELNARRCGESHANAIAERLYGEEWMEECCAITRLPYSVQFESEVTVDTLLDAFEITNAIFKKKGVLVIPTQVSWLNQTNPGIGYVVIGTNKEVLKSAESALHRNLLKVGIRGRES